ncbi:hypothetical protein SLS62_007363 [Diatrype stigma]|uniref:3-phytase n=1 Tax=Diatrype stigma TaxID=117547 RepID=A0AAN9YMA5_9PEZI
MSISKSLVISLLAAAKVFATIPQYLAPAQDINSPSSQSARDPLQQLGANGPWYAGKMLLRPMLGWQLARLIMYIGPNIFGISADPPENCYVEQAAYISRHGSRYPDQGAYDGWVSMYERFQSANYTATGSLAFLSTWQPVLADPALQIAQENPTGAKEAYDFGYTLRTRYFPGIISRWLVYPRLTVKGRYPDLYRPGDEFMVWANNYTRVLQTASMFVRGFLGFAAAQNGSVVSVTSKGFPAAVGDSLAPSDMCPAFKDTEGGDFKTTWDAIWIPPVLKRLQGLIGGNLTLTASDVSQMPYLCGFESHATGRLSPWCGVLTDAELAQYEYANDLRYYYGVGPGTDLPRKMMTPFLNALVGLLQKGGLGDGTTPLMGTKADGSSFELPRLLVSFLNDGQLTELITTSGIFDAQRPLSPTEKDDSRLWVGSRFVTMRGTIAFERLNCVVGDGGGRGRGDYPRYSKPGSDPMATMTNATYVRVRLNDAVYPLPFCRDGPGSSCPLNNYARYVSDKYVAEGDWISNCNVTVTGETPEVVKGASFFTDLRNPWVTEIVP